MSLARYPLLNEIECLWQKSGFIRLNEVHQRHQFNFTCCSSVRPYALSFIVALRWIVHVARLQVHIMSYKWPSLILDPIAGYSCSCRYYGE